MLDKSNMSTLSFLFLSLLFSLLFVKLLWNPFSIITLPNKVGLASFVSTYYHWNLTLRFQLCLASCFHCHEIFPRTQIFMKHGLLCFWQLQVFTSWLLNLFLVSQNALALSQEQGQHSSILNCCHLLNKKCYILKLQRYSFYSIS